MGIENGPMIYTLVDEEQNEQKFEVLDFMELDDELYYAMTPYYEDADNIVKNSGELIVLKRIFCDDQEFFSTINDDDEYNKIGNIFIEKLENMFDDQY